MVAATPSAAADAAVVAVSVSKPLSAARLALMVLRETCGGGGGREAGREVSVVLSSY
jgi:hypothetical protein